MWTKRTSWNLLRWYGIILYTCVLKHTCKMICGYCTVYNSQIKSLCNTSWRLWHGICQWRNPVGRVAGPWRSTTENSLAAERQHHVCDMFQSPPGDLDAIQNRNVKMAFEHESISKFIKANFLFEGSRSLQPVTARVTAACCFKFNGVGSARRCCC